MASLVKDVFLRRGQVCYQFYAIAIDFMLSNDIFEFGKQNTNAKIMIHLC